MPVVGSRVSELVAAGDLALPADIGPNDVSLFLDAQDTTGLHSGPGGNLKPLPAQYQVLTDATHDVSLVAGTWASSGPNTGHLVGGNVKQATLFHVDHSYTATENPLPRSSGGQLGVGFLYTGDVHLNYVGGGDPNGPLQATGFFGTRAIFSNELTQTVHQDQWKNAHGPIGFADVAMLKNVAGATRQITPGYVFLSARLVAADGGAVTLNKTDIGDGLTAFSDDNMLVTAGGGTITAHGVLAPYQMTSFEVVTGVLGNVTLDERVGLKVRDVGLGGPGYGAIFDTVPAFGERLTGTVDDGPGTVTTQYGVLIERLVNAGTNIGIQSDAEVRLWQDTNTFTTTPGDVLTFPGSFTFQTSANITPKAVSLTPTYVVDTTLNALFGATTMFYSAPTIKSAANATARDLKSIRGFLDAVTVTADSSADTLSSLSSFFSAPTFNTTGGGTHTLAVTDLNVFHASGAAIGSGVTVTNRRGLYVQDPTGAGALVNNYGVDVARMVKGTGVVAGIRNNSPTRFWDDTVTLTTGGPMHVVSTPGTWTFGAGSDLIGLRIFRADPTIVIDTAVNLLYGEVRPFLNSTTLQSQTNSTVRNLQDMQGFRDAPLIQGNTSADTMFMVHSHVAAPRIGAINGGALLLDNLLCFSAYGQAFDGGTITNRTGLYVSDVEKVGTGVCTNQYGIDIERFVNASTTNVGIRNRSSVVLWDDTVTFTANPPHLINVPGTWTLGSGSDLPPRLFDVTATIVVDTALNAFAVPSLIRNALTYKAKDSATVRDLKDMRSFFDTPTIEADTAADTMASFSSFVSAPSFSRLNNGLLSLTDIHQLWAKAPTVNVGITVTTLRGVHVEDATGVGTVSNAYGVDVASITKGGTKNRAIRVGSGGIEIAAVNAANETSTTNLPSSAFCIYTKGTKVVFAFNNAGTIRYVSIDFAANGNAITTTTVTAP